MTTDIDRKIYGLTHLDAGRITPGRHMTKCGRSVGWVNTDPNYTDCPKCMMAVRQCGKGHGGRKRLIAVGKRIGGVWVVQKPIKKRR